MKKIEEALWRDYDEISESIKSIRADKQNYAELYKVALEEKDKIRNEIIQEKIINDVKIESENKRDKTKNRITIATFSVTTIVSVLLAIETFAFDQGHTLTGTLSRGILNGFIPKLPKR